MKYTALLVAALLFLPLAAGAQPVPRSPMGASVQRTSGITVTGEGSTRIPATSATIISMELTFPDGSCRTQYYINPTGLNSDPSAPQTPQDYVTVPATANISITYAIK